MSRTRLPLWLLKNSDQAKLLRAVAQPVVLSEVAKPEFQQLIDDMVVTMYQANGVGLAAPQVGLSIRLAVIAGEAADRHEAVVLINPVIERPSHSQLDMEEGCLSIPKKFDWVPRAQSLTLRAFDRLGKPYTLKAEDFFARVIQHEVDHLNGRLFIDRVAAPKHSKQ